MKTFFFYDLETSGLKPREDRIMQFAGQRTDMELNPIGEPVNVLVKMTNDALPSPSAINVTGITPQQTLMDGIGETEFCRYIIDEIFIPDTIAVGYNSLCGLAFGGIFSILMNGSGRMSVVVGTF